MIGVSEASGKGGETLAYTKTLLDPGTSMMVSTKCTFSSEYMHEIQPEACCSITRGNHLIHGTEGLDCFGANAVDSTHEDLGRYVKAATVSP